MKKKILIIALAVVLIAGAVAFPFVRFMVDFKDTEDAYRANVVHSGLRDNTIETAIPQTELYNIIKGHFEGELPEGKTEKKAIIIGYDGCRVDALKLSDGGIKYMIENGASANYAYCGGVNYPEKNTQDTSTAPGWCSILTGVWADKHGVTANDITKSMEYKTLLTSLVEDETIDSSMFITKWKGHFDRKNATYLEEKSYCEENNLNVTFARCDDDAASYDFAIKEIEQKNCADFLFVIYEHTDSAGHNSGFTYNNPKYRQAFIDMDNYGLDTIKAIEGRETYETEDWLIIIASDHGGIGTDHGGDSVQERMTFIVMNKEFNTNGFENLNKEVVFESPTESSTETTTFWEQSTTKKPYVKPTESTTFDLRVCVKEIKVTQLPTQTTYYTDEIFSADGIVVTGYFTDGTVMDITHAVTFSDVNTLTTGKKRVTVEYVDDELNLAVTQFYVTVIEPETIETDTTIPDVTETE